VIAATTPIGSRTISELPISSSQWNSWTIRAMVPNIQVGRPAWINRATWTGIPISREIRGGDLVAALGKLGMDG